jgi:two-component system sporulation sensor kinase B
MMTLHIIKDLLLHILIILLPIFLYHTFWGEHTKNSRYVIASFTTISVVLTMSFAVSFGEGYLYDLRLVPLTIAFLYGGYRVGLITLAVLFAYRFYFGGQGFYATLIVYTCLSTALIFLGIYYHKLALRMKLLAAASLPVFMILMTLPVFKILGREISIYFMLIHGSIQLITISITVYLIEMIRKQWRLEREIIRAEKMNAISQLAASVAHEIRNPMTVVKGFMQLFNEKKWIPQEEKTYISMMLQELDRAQSIINDYLSLAKPHTEELQTLNIKKNIEHVLNIMLPYAAMASIEIKAEIEDFLYIRANNDEINQVLVNIIKNGIESMENGGMLRVAASRKYSMIEVHIQIQEKAWNKKY